MHPREIELARFSDEEAGAEADGRHPVADHLRWCARCRSDVADYRWLQGEVTTALSAAADGVDVPRSRWWAVREAVSASERRQVAGGRVSALASVVSAICLMLALSPVLNPAAMMRASFLEAGVVTPPPVQAVVSAGPGSPVATPTPAAFREAVTPVPTPAFMLPPTPPEPEV